MYVAHKGKPEGDTRGVEFFHHVDGIWVGEVRDENHAAEYLVDRAFAFWGGALVPVKPEPVAVEPVAKDFVKKSKN